jgi:uncharacterized protein (DUF697 family)
MFDNIGAKIKKLAVGIFVVELIFFSVCGLSLMTKGMSSLVIIGMLVIFGGAFFAWVSAFFVYAYGEITEKVCDISKKTSDIEKIKNTLARIEKTNHEKYLQEQKEKKLNEKEN